MTRKRTIIPIILLFIAFYSSSAQEVTFIDQGKWRFEHYPVLSVYLKLKRTLAHNPKYPDIGQINEIEFLDEGFANIIANGELFKAVYKILPGQNQEPWIWDIFFTTSNGRFRLNIMKVTNGLFFQYDLLGSSRIFGERIKRDEVERLFVYTGNIRRVE